jgi:hypothetical protein
MTGLLVFGILAWLSASANELRAECFPIGPVSEEKRNPAVCPAGYGIKGISCQGSYCDDKILLCCSYTSSRVDEPSWWSPQFSEEGSGRYWDSRGIAKGLACYGNYCDNISLIFATPTSASNSGQCSWTYPFSEEGAHQAQCGFNSFVAGLHCSGSNCDSLSLYCCHFNGAVDGVQEGIRVPYPGLAGKGDSGNQ